LNRSVESGGRGGIEPSKVLGKERRRIGAQSLKDFYSGKEGREALIIGIGKEWFNKGRIGTRRI